VRIQVLEHADRRDLVVGAGHVTEVGDFRRDAPLESERFRAGQRLSDLTYYQLPRTQFTRPQAMAMSLLARNLAADVASQLADATDPLAAIRE
jgi:hypothetical protein